MDREQAKKYAAVLAESLTGGTPENPESTTPVKEVDRKSNV